MMCINGLCYCGRSRADRDLQLLIPQPRLLISDLVMQFRLLVCQFEALLTQLHHGERQNRSTAETQKQLDHDVECG